MYEKTISAGLIGAGRIGMIHAKNIQQLVNGIRLKWVCDIILEDARLCAEKAGIENFSSNVNDIFNDEEIKAVIICSSTDTHAELINLAAETGKAVFCEKPISLDTDIIKDSLSRVEQSGIKLQIGFNRRFDHNFARAHKAIKDGTLGNIHSVRITSRDPIPPPIHYIKKSGGLFFDMTIHDFDMIRYLMDCEVAEVYAIGAVLIDQEIGRAGDIDTALISLKFKNGALGFIENSRMAVYGYDQRIEVFGSKGMIEVGNVPSDTLRLSTEKSVQSALPDFFFLERYSDAYIMEMQCFVDSIIDDSHPLVTGLDGLEPVYLARACMVSMQEKRRVCLDEIR